MSAVAYAPVFSTATLEQMVAGVRSGQVPGRLMAALGAAGVPVDTDTEGWSTITAPDDSELWVKIHPCRASHCYVLEVDADSILAEEIAEGCAPEYQLRECSQVVGFGQLLGTVARWWESHARP